MNHFQSTKEEDDGEVRRGPWTLEEDNLLIQYISCHGEGRWNLLAKSAGLKRTGKSCRLRWLNYLKPDIKRGNLTPQEQLLILELHSKWGNRWSKIAHHLPGRTDNEIKNYWRTRVQKQAKQLNMESNSQSFVDAIRCFYMPRLVEKIEQTSTTLSATTMDFSTLATASSSSPFSTSTVLPVSPRKPGDNSNLDYGFNEISNSAREESSSSIVMPSYESTMHSNSLEFSEQPVLNAQFHAFGEAALGKEGPVLLADDNCYYVDNSNYDNIDEMVAMSTMGAFSYNHMANHGWFADEVADDTWNLDGLW